MQPKYDKTCIVLEEGLADDEAEAHIRMASARGYEAADRAYPPSYRNNDRLVLDDKGMAAELYGRFGPGFPHDIIDGQGTRWELDGLNSRFRYCRYRPGQWFSLHRDGAYYDGDDRRSFLTFMIYLNAPPEFSGGGTRFFEHRRANSEAFTVAPEKGRAVVFSHRWWHDGAVVTDGTKYIMRSDVMYRRRASRAAEGHHGYVWAVSSLDDGTIVSGGRDKTIKVWSDGTCTRTLRGHDLSVTTLMPTSDGLWSGSRDGTIRKWDLSTGQCQRIIPAHDGTVLQLCELAPGCLVSAGADGAVASWSRQGACVNPEQRHEGWVWALAASPDGRLASGGEDGVICFGNRATGIGSPLRSVVFADGLLVSGSATGRIDLWSGGLIQVDALTGHDGAATAMVALADGRLASAGEDDRIRIWDLANSRCVQTLQHDDFVRSLTLDRRGRLVSGSYDGTIRVWDIGS
ncbi:MAG: 2OG-Fe(II) oxygenase [Planctomycetota bacterium]